MRPPDKERIVRQFVDEIFYINLAEDDGRRRSIVEQLDAAGVGRYSHVEGVRLLYPFAYGGLSLLPGGVGCTLSHLRIYRMMADKGIETALVLEDDADLHADFAGLLARCLVDLPARYDILYLHNRNTGRVLDDSRRFVRQVRLAPLGTHAYVVRRRVAEAMLSSRDADLFQVVEAYRDEGASGEVKKAFQIDLLLRHVLRRGYRIFQTKECLASQGRLQSSARKINQSFR